MLLIGVDVGGTFTDIVFTDTDANRTLTHKVASTPEDPSRAFMRGVSEICATAGVGLAALDHIFHGTTVATNAALQYRGARAGMITTHGFRDIVHIGRISARTTTRCSRTSVAVRRCAAGTARSCRALAPRAARLQPLDEEAAQAALSDAGVARSRSVSVSFNLARASARRLSSGCVPACS
jgi:N-methylhydantoinase A/oxoprolinase/acetone carboxylase beta subunit